MCVISKESKNVMVVLLVIVNVLIILLYAIKPLSWEEAAQDLIFEHVKEMNTTGYDVILASESSLKNTPKIIFIFETDANPNIEEARIKYVRAVELLLDKVNSHEAIKPYLQTSPLETKDISYALSFKGKKVTLGTVKYAFYSEGNIVYNALDPNADNKGAYTVVFRESYSEALKIVRGGGLLEQSASK